LGAQGEGGHEGRPYMPRQGGGVQSAPARPMATVYPFLRRLLFRLDPEAGHAAGMGALRAAQVLSPVRGALVRRNLVDDPRLRQTLFGREVPNPVGLAAGLDKDAVAVRGMAALGFGFLEVGTVTPLPQPGNPRPRLFRFPAAGSLQNAMGFNNQGMEAMRRRLEEVYPLSVPLGINIGKNKATPPERALDDYETLMRGLAHLGDYLVVNLSSPNTPGLRDLQNEEFIRSVLGLAKEITPKPVLVKIAPDLEPGTAADLSEVAVEAGAAGIIATNTTTEYALLPGCKDFGGLSGRVLKEKSFRVFEAVARRLFGRAVLISVGGIDSGAEAWRRLKAGASLVQVYTALIYQGPGLVRRINREILEIMGREGVEALTPRPPLPLRPGTPAPGEGETY
jgi:dihydroorotate dehydrogenase